MKQSLKEKALAYLESHNVMTLATHGPEGLWAAAVFCVSDDFKLYFLSAPTTRHGRNLTENPRVAATRSRWAILLSYHGNRASVDFNRSAG